MKVGAAKYTIDGESVSEAEYLKRMKAKGKLEGIPSVARAWEKPMVCEALAVDPLEVKYEKQLDREQGLSVNYNEHGCPIFESRKQRNDYVRAKGYFDKNAGYGDVCPQNR